MKLLVKYFNLALLFVVMLLATPMCYALSPGDLPAEDTDYSAIFATTAAFMVVLPVIVEALKKAFKVDGGFWAQFIAWITGIVVALFGYFFNIGLFADVNWWQSIIIGFLCSLGANGVFDIPVISWLIQTIFGTKKSGPEEG